MPTFRVTGGALTLDSAGLNYPSNELPGSPPGIDNSLPPGTPPIGPDNTLPEPPVGIWPPPSFSRPIVPIGPDNTLPVAPGTIWPSPGGPMYPTTGPVRPPTGSTQPLPGGGRPDNTLPGGQGGQIDNALPSQKFWVVAGIPGLGWRYVCVDPSLRPGHALPPHAQPK
jgi:hypothetical protein